MSPHHNIAWFLRTHIESGASEEVIGQATQDLVWALGGTADVRGMTPGAAALYVLALYIAKQGGEHEPR